jgi:sterol desaturase/sphingolipid hydroxylase (fatty acid hydroxylase superfamily)
MTAGPDRSLIGRVTTSPINYWATFITDALAAAAFGWLGATRYAGSYLVGALLVIAGFLSWTLFEYLLHRFVLHGWTKAAREHAKHHRDTHALISTPLLTIPLLALVIFFAIAFAASSGVAALLTFGLYAGYNYFVVVHHMQHFHPQLLARSGLFERNLRLHVLHHDRPDMHFGISCSIWDRAFGSHLLERDQVVVKQAGGEPQSNEL